MSREERRCFTIIFSPLAEKSQFIPVIQGVSVKTRIMLTSRFLKNCFDWCILYQKLSNCVFHFLQLFNFSALHLMEIPLDGANTVDS